MSSRVELCGNSPSLQTRCTVPLLLQYEGSRLTRNLTSRRATSPCRMLGMVCRSSSSCFLFLPETFGPLRRKQTMSITASFSKQIPPAFVFLHVKLLLKFVKRVVRSVFKGSVHPNKTHISSGISSCRCCDIDIHKLGVRAPFCCEDGEILLDPFLQR